MWPFSKPPLISVVIASFNHASYVQDSVRSVLAQNEPSLEIVITDDGSTDATVQQIQALEHPCIQLNVFPENRGACAALNDAIGRSRGRYIAILNSDDLFLPGKLRKQLTYLEQHPPIAAVFGLPAFINEQGEPYSDPSHKDSQVFKAANRPRHQWLRHFFELGNALCHPTVMIRRTAYNTVGLYDPRLAQVPDLDQWIRLCMDHEIHVLHEPLTAFRIRDQQQNASAARPEVVIRDAWERAYILRHYLRLSEANLLKVFPEFAHQSGTVAEKLAQHALKRDYPFFHRFALDAWFNELPDGTSPSHPGASPDPTACRRFITAVGAHDLHRIYP